MAYSAGTDEWDSIQIVGWFAMREQRIARADRLYSAPPPRSERLMDTLAEWVNAGNPPGRSMSTAPTTQTWTGGSRAEMIPHSREEIQYCASAASRLPEDTVLVGIVPPDSRKQFILVTGITWDNIPLQKYYEVALNTRN